MPSVAVLVVVVVVVVAAVAVAVAEGVVVVVAVGVAVLNVLAGTLAVEAPPARRVVVVLLLASTHETNPSAQPSATSALQNVPPKLVFFLQATRSAEPIDGSTWSHQPHAT